jgi:phage terminase small subunit
LIQSPYLAIGNRQAEIMMRIASEFGFTPASRSRISAPPKDQLPSLMRLSRKADRFAMWDL